MIVEKKLFNLFLQHLALLSMFCVVHSCANIKPISGGPEDKEAPVLLKDKSSPDQFLNCREKKFSFTFNEWISLNNPSQNIIIIPTLKKPLITKLRGKTLQISIDDEDTLAANTTYSIYFGDAIKDITNNNIASNLRYVFSTGSFIDSLSIGGAVKDAFTNKPVDKALILLYSNLQDSAFKTSRPDYFVFGDKAGNFNLKNIKSGKYQLYALLDKNQNYYYDQRTEAIAFHDTMITLEGNSLSGILFNMSEEKGKNFLKDKKILDGRIRLLYTQSAEKVTVNCAGCTDTYLHKEKDSLIYWFHVSDTTPVYLTNEDKIDTFYLNPVTWKTKSTKFKITRYTRQIIPGQSLSIYFNEPIASFDTGKISFSQKLNFSARIDTVDKRKLNIYPIDARVERLNLMLMDSALLGIQNSYNMNDTLHLNVIAYSSLSRLRLEIDSLQTGKTYLIQILNSDKVLEERSFKAISDSIVLKFDHLFPGKYEARIIEDRNNNGSWDPAIFAERIQAEKVEIFPLKELRADWDLEMKIILRR